MYYIEVIGAWGGKVERKQNNENPDSGRIKHSFKWCGQNKTE